MSITLLKAEHVVLLKVFFLGHNVRSHVFGGLGWWFGSLGKKPCSTYYKILIFDSVLLFHFLFLFLPYFFFTFIDPSIYILAYLFIYLFVYISVYLLVVSLRNPLYLHQTPMYPSWNLHQKAINYTHMRSSKCKDRGDLKKGACPPCTFDKGSIRFI